jgi:hypothetical protein
VTTLGSPTPSLWIPAAKQTCHHHKSFSSSPFNSTIKTVAIFPLFYTNSRPHHHHLITKSNHGNCWQLTPITKPGTSSSLLLPSPPFNQIRTKQSISLCSPPTRALCTITTTHSHPSCGQEPKSGNPIHRELSLPPSLPRTQTTNGLSLTCAARARVQFVLPLSPPSISSTTPTPSLGAQPSFTVAAHGDSTRASSCRRRELTKLATHAATRPGQCLHHHRRRLQALSPDRNTAASPQTAPPRAGAQSSSSDADDPSRLNPQRRITAKPVAPSSSLSPLCGEEKKDEKE